MIFARFVSLDYAPENKTTTDHTDITDRCEGWSNAKGDKRVPRAWVLSEATLFDLNNQQGISIWETRLGGINCCFSATDLRDLHSVRDSVLSSFRITPRPATTLFSDQGRYGGLDDAAPMCFDSRSV